MKTWKDAINVVKWVMDTVGPIARVCTLSFLLIHPLTYVVQLNPCATLAWSMFSKIPEVSLLFFPGTWVTPLFLAHLSTRLCYGKFSVTITSKHSLR
jgi:hypothetical protein